MPGEGQVRTCVWLEGREVRSWESGATFLLSLSWVSLSRWHALTSICWLSASLRRVQGNKRKWDMGRGFLVPLPGRKTNPETLNSNAYICGSTEFYDAGSALTAPPAREDQQSFVLMLSHGFLNKWMFYGRVWRVQAFESGKSGFESRLFDFIAVRPWAIDSVCLGHISLLGKMGKIKPNFGD